MGAEELVDHITKTAKEITNKQPSKIVSITTDTCSAMKATSKTLENTLGFKHILTLPCDSHGLQLLIKDILQQPNIKSTWSAATAIVNKL
jgi:vacuolar-type H+-ATPase subunit F/Vma7